MSTASYDTSGFENFPVAKMALDRALHSYEEGKKLIIWILNDIPMPTKQIAAGVGSGWLTGIFVLTMARAAALLTGGGLLSFQVAKEIGMIEVDWPDIRKMVVDNIDTKTVKCSAKWLAFLKRNSCFSATFVSGFLFGMAL